MLDEDGGALRVAMLDDVLGGVKCGILCKLNDLFT
jgi:hypothetical protein